MGWIFTDLEAQKGGKVAYKRSIVSPAACTEPKPLLPLTHTQNTHLLSAEECIMAAHFQNKHSNPCKLSKTGKFGSKFITVCVSGDESNQIHLKGYQVSVGCVWCVCVWCCHVTLQVSNQCMALVRDDCLLPTLDAPELGYVRESTAQRYVPDVFYKVSITMPINTPPRTMPRPLTHLLVQCHAH